MNEPRDKGAYRIAVGAIGCALIVVLAGLCVIVAVGIKDTEIPKELWTIASALGGGLLGLLAPSPAPSAAKEDKVKEIPGGLKRTWTILVKDIGANRSVAILLFIFAFAVGFGVATDSTQLQALAGASGAALIGLLAPGPGKVATEK
ncbi:MAG: hypothetical protein QOF13_967 [Solirubrobacterales bacterium]|nr:hypothetical protein [Solirubrobacterales bacterium]